MNGDQMSDHEEISIDEIVNRIITLNDRLNRFWTKAEGWAPAEAGQLLSKSRLDWQVSLSRTLKIWFDESSSGNEDGRLILAWVNLGSLVEGTMKLCLSVWYNDYQKDSEAIKNKKGALKDPDILELEKMRHFFKKRIWGTVDEHWDAWIEKIQKRRNAVHAFKDTDIGTFDEFFVDVRKYLEFLQRIDEQLPYP
jgi:hypothetical protein